jgi:hypothetical protein
MRSRLFLLTLAVVWPGAAAGWAADAGDRPSAFRFEERAGEGTLTVFEKERPVYSSRESTEPNALTRRRPLSRSPLLSQ